MNLHRRLLHGTSRNSGPGVRRLLVYWAQQSSSYQIGRSAFIHKALNHSQRRLEVLSTIKEKKNNNWIHQSSAKRQRPVEKLPSGRKPVADPASGGWSHLRSPVGGRRLFQKNEKIEIEVVSEYQTARSLHDWCMKQPCDKTSEPDPPSPHTCLPTRQRQRPSRRDSVGCAT